MWKKSIAALAAATALLARVYLYEKDYTNAAKYATLVINDGAFKLTDKASFPSIYTTKSGQESILELPFNQQNPSFYNALTYARPEADATEGRRPAAGAASPDAFCPDRRKQSGTTANATIDKIRKTSE